MTTRKLTKSRLALIAAVALSLCLVVAGCGDDKNNNPANNSGSQQFDEAFATQQSGFLVNSVVDQMAGLPSYVNGITGKADDIYTWGWVDDPGRWEGSYTGTYEDFTSTWNVWLQYLNALGSPQQEPLGAASMAYHADAALSGSGTGEGFSYALDFDYGENFAAAGLGTTVLLINGDGSTAIDYTYTSDGSTASASYTAGWEILDPGISFPLDGCPTGTMEFTMAPFTVTVVFDGSDTATYTMRNGSTIIPEGSGTTLLDCGVPLGNSE